MKQVDKNLIVETKINKPGVKFYDILEKPFSIYGIWYDGDRFYRVPKEGAPLVSPSIVQKSTQTAGGRVRFVTDSKYVAVKLELHNTEEVSVMTTVGAKGLDLYEDGNFVRSFVPPYRQGDGDFESVVSLDTPGEHEITIHFPLYAGVKSFYVGLDGGATLKSAKPYKHGKPVVYYGSSITNGASASRPGMTYEAILSRMLDCDHHNLGFGGSAKGESAIAEYVASLDMSVFVYDYDHNAPTVDHLAATHEAMFKTVRASHPTTPIIMLSRPQFAVRGDRDVRYEVIKQTYDNARASGDGNVYLIRGSEIFPGLDADFTVDGTHPTDLGFYYMANALKPLLDKLLNG